MNQIAGMDPEKADKESSASRPMAVATLWGFAEATLFFIVPDVWTSVAGRTQLKTGLQACLFAMAGALLGGTLMYVWGSLDEAAAITVVEKLPAISTDMVERANSELDEHKGFALFTGPLRVTPYKIYAVHSSGAGIGFVTFLLVSLPSRLIRFLAITLFSHYALKLLPLFRIKIRPLTALVTAWVVFYIFYFTLLPG
jgi:membrane protein DedA with SNARE-associated domain